MTRFLVQRKWSVLRGKISKLIWGFKGYKNEFKLLLCAILKCYYHVHLVKCFVQAECQMHNTSDSQCVLCHLRCSLTFDILVLTDYILGLWGLEICIVSNHTRHPHVSQAMKDWEFLYYFIIKCIHNFLNCTLTGKRESVKLRD